MSAEISEIIDLNRYPVDNPESELARQIIQNCQRDIDQRALCMLPDFVRPEAVKPMAAELESLLDNASRFDIQRTAYIKPVDPSLPDDHPRKVSHPTRYHQVLNYQISNNSPLRKLFYWQPLTDFLGRAMGYERFYRSDCPHLGLTAKIAGEGDTDGWHFDSNEAVFSLVLQDAEEGGEFEYLPKVRNDHNQNYDTVAAAFQQPDQFSTRFKIKPGTLVLFRGMASVHRVTPVIGNRRRIVALFSYHTEPGHVNGQSYISLVHSQMPQPGINLNSTL